jgi:NAD(P)-dependent dehydrogenase (short-subunit alcohol dehydrogenase family)
MIKDILVVGGTSGLGLELAEKYTGLGHRVIITGRQDPQKPNLKFLPFDIGMCSEDISTAIDALLSEIPRVNTLIYAAGYYQEGAIDTLSDDNVLQMVNVGLVAPALLIRRLKNNPGKPLKIILITSSSQYTPREKEPMYTAAKAALGMLGNSLGLDLSLGKVLVVAPSGMQTPFWKKGEDISGYLDPKWVAGQIIELSSGPFKYRYAKILRGPARVEIIETRQAEA